MSSELAPGSRTKSSGRLLAILLLTTIAALGVVVVINCVVNPYAFYPSRSLPPLVWQSRRLKAEMLEARARMPEALILGSSRTMKVAPSQIRRLTGLDTFNAGVDSARAEDWTVLYRYATEGLKAQIREVVIGVDVESFHNHSDADQRLLGTHELRPFVPLNLKWRWYLHAAQESLSWDQLVDSFRSITYHFRGYPPAKYRFDPDGVLHYVEWEQQMVAGTFHWDPSLDEYDGRLLGMTGLADWRCRSFEELVSLAQARGARVRAFVTPLQATLLEHLRRTRDYDRLRSETVAYLQKEAGRFSNLRVVDFTEVSAFGGQEHGFLDGAHTTDENSAIMTEALWKQTAFPAP